MRTKFHRGNNPLRSVTSVIATTLIVACPLGAVAQGSATAALSATAGPIAITSCESLKTNSGYGMGNVTIFGHATYFFKIAFTNQSRISADNVKFRFDFNKDRMLITDAGTYGPGMDVTHTLRTGKGVDYSARPGGNGSLLCTVAYAHFSDGTEWSAPPEPSPAPSP